MRFFLFLVCFAGSVIGLRGAEDYELRMTRPVKVGDRFAHEGKYREETKTVMKLDRRPIRAEEQNIDLQYATEDEVLKVDARGKPMAIRIKMVKIEGTMNGKPVPVAVGDQIEVSRAEGSGEKEVLINKAPASKEQSRLILGIVSLSPPNSPNDDDVFGPKKRIAPGEEWKVNPEQAVKQATDHGMEGLKAEGVSGKTKMIGVVETDGKSCLRIHGEFEIKGAGMVAPKAPPEVKISKMLVKVMADGDFPVDTADTASPSQTLMMTMEMEAGGLIKAQGVERNLEITANGKVAKTETARVMR